jgi:hypothetical protein
MAREIPDIEESLQLCKDMDSPSVVIPESKIQKYFPSPSPPGHKDIPCYDLGELKAWAEEKGWTVTFATTGTLTNKKMVPGIRFTPLFKKDSIPSTAGNPTADIPNNVNNWQNKTLYYIAVGVIIAVLAVFVIYLIRKHLGIPL